jgi:hypothetical protein
LKTYRTNFQSRTIEESYDLIRAERDLILNETVDRMNPLRWASLSDTKKTEWANFRLRLLSITQRVNGTFIVEWPEVPSNHDAVVTEEVTPDSPA